MQTLQDLVGDYGNSILLVLSGVVPILEVPIPFCNIKKWVVGYVDSEVSIITVIDLDDVFRLTLDCKDDIITELAFTRLPEGKTGISLTHGQILNNSSKMFEINVALEENKHRQKILQFLLLVMFLALKEGESKRQTGNSELLIPPLPDLEAREYSKNGKPISQLAKRKIQMDEACINWLGRGRCSLVDEIRNQGN